MSKRFEMKGLETKTYIRYLCAVLNLYAHMSLDANI